MSNRILIIRTDRIGDVVLSTPVIRTLRRTYPDAYIGMMVRPENRELVDGNPDLNEVVLYDKEGEHKSWLATLRFAFQLKTKRYDTAVILHSTNRAILVSFFAGIKRRIGYARRLPWLLTDPVPYVKKEGQRHELDYNLDLLKPIGIRSAVRDLFIPTAPAQQKKVENFLFHEGIGNNPYIVIHPGASCPSKRWPFARFAALADRLIHHYGIEVVVIAGPGDKKTGEEMVRSMAYRPAQALGIFSLGETACLLKGAKCLISNDSGPVHIASAVGAPVAAIFGRWGGGLSPTRWGPTGPNSRILHKDIGCRPCLAHACTIGFACLGAITVDEAEAAVQQLAGLVRKKDEVTIEIVS